MLIHVWFYNDSVTVRFNDTTIKNVSHFNTVTLSDLANDYGKVYANDSGWSCFLPDEHREKFTEWITTIPSVCFS